MRKTFPSFDLGIDHLFPSEPEERNQKKEEQQRLLEIQTTSLKGLQAKTAKYATKYTVNVFKVIFAFNYYNKILKITFCFFKKCTIKLNANSTLQTANVLKSNFTLPIGCRVLAVKCSKNDHLRGHAPKKRPIISGSKIETADFYLPSRGYRVLFKNDFLLFQFRFKPKIWSRKLFPSDSSQIRPKISPRQKRFRNHYRNAK